MYMYVYGVCFCDRVVDYLDNDQAVRAMAEVKSKTYVTIQCIVQYSLRPLSHNYLVGPFADCIIPTVSQNMRLRLFCTSTTFQFHAPKR